MVVNMEPINIPEMGYDRAITVFSPNGRLYQVEYAREAVKKGTVSLGIKYADGIVMAVDKNITDPLMVADATEKIYKLDDHMAAATSGLVADGRRLVDKMRLDAQAHKLTYGEAIGIDLLVKKVTDFKQMYTQMGGIRPFGVALLIAGIDNDGELHLYETDPSGSFWEYTATAIGERSDPVKEIFRKKYSKSLSKEDAVELALEALYKGTEEQYNSDSIEIALIEKKTRKYYRLSDAEVQEYLDKTVSSLKKKKK